MSIVINYNKNDEKEEVTVSEAPAQESDEQTVDLADIAWKTEKGSNHLTELLNSALNENSGDEYSMSYWVHDVDVKSSKALVCENYKNYYVVPFVLDKKGELTLSDESEWTTVEQAWVDSNSAYLSQENIVAEVYLTAAEKAEEKDGLIWKTIAREGTWKYRPGDKQKPVESPLTFVKSGKSNADKFIVSIEELKNNFDSGAKQYVTVPISHDDKPLENTGFVREMKIEEEGGKVSLRAGIEFTESDVKEKVLNGSIADISSGILFDYIKKDDGKKYNAVVGHTALTNNPWLNGMQSFEINASEELKILAFSEENILSKDVSEETLEPQGGDNEVEVTEKDTSFLTEMGLSEDEVKARLKEYESLKTEQKKNRIDEKIRKWQEDGVSPALVLAAESILAADEGVAVLNLSEDGTERSLTATNIVERLIAATPIVKLSDDKVTDKDVEGDRPADDTEDENKEAEMSLAEKSLAYSLYFEEGFSKEDAAAEAKIRLAKSN